MYVLVKLEHTCAYMYVGLSADKPSLQAWAYVSKPMDPEGYLVHF
jgi:hypothetical protein